MRLWHCSRILLELLNVWLFQRWFFRWWVGSWHWHEFITAIVMFKQKLSTIWWKSKRVLIADRLIFLWRFLFFSTLWLRVCWNQSVQSIWAAGEKKLALVWFCVKRIWFIFVLGMLGLSLFGCWIIPLILNCDWSNHACYKLEKNRVNQAPKTTTWKMAQTPHSSKINMLEVEEVK